MTFREYLNENKDLKKMLKVQKGLNREAALERQKFVGKPRSNSWGGRPTNKEDRRASKQDIKKEL